jgi:hypothetical protein
VIDMGEVDVSLHPVSTRGDANFDDENVPTPRFVESGNPQTVISVTPCETTLLFPFVTGAEGYMTGIAITNTSTQDGSCTAEFFGPDAPDPMDSPEEIASERQWIFLTALGFTGYLTVECNFQDGKGFAFVSNSEVAHGYIAEDTTDD